MHLKFMGFPVPNASVLEVPVRFGAFLLYGARPWEAGEIPARSKRPKIKDLAIFFAKRVRETLENVRPTLEDIRATMKDGRVMP